jgi:hypothetical protein
LLYRLRKSGNFCYNKMRNLNPKYC